MPRYAVGDLQGCLAPLLCLLDEINFDQQEDQLWLVGDLINRGPQSLETLRFLKSLDDTTHGQALRIVLGNHDLHFLAITHHAVEQQKSDTLLSLLQADDCMELAQWLQQKPLLYTDPAGDFTMTHAGIPPIWSLAQATQLADEVHSLLQSDNASDFFHHMYGNEPQQWDEKLMGPERLRLITNYFTRMRFCNNEGALDLTNKLNVSDQPDFSPWFSFPSRKTKHNAIIFGHWAALNGNTNTDNVFALDTGCVWGNKMSLLNLETLETHQCDCSAID